MDSVFVDNILAILYLLAWILTFIWYHRKYGNFDAGTAIIATYILYAFFSILSLNDPIFSTLYEPLHLIPFIFLYLMKMMALSPTIYYHLHPVPSIEDPHTRVIKLLAIIFVASALLMIPEILTNFSSGFVKLFTDIDAGKENYTEQIEKAEDAGSAIKNLPAIIFNTMSDIGIFIFFYLMTKKEKNLWLSLGLLAAIVIGLLQPVMLGQRGGVISRMLTIIVCYMFFRKFLSKRINHAVQILGIGLVILISLPIAAITMSRFGDEKQASVGGFMTWYAGQGNLYFNNYGLDAGGIRYGDRTMNLFKRLVDSSTPKNYAERRDKYSHLQMDDYYYTTFVGDFCIDFGPIIAFVIFLVFNTYVLIQLRPRGDCIKLHQMLILYFTICVCMQGGMTLFSYSDSGNLSIVMFIMLYAYLRYHDELLLHFPLKESVSDNQNQEE